MNVSRNFLIMGSVYLLVGIGFGMYMGGSEDRTMTPVHAHINLLGFTLMTVFGLGYRLIPALAASRLAPVHFWLHQAGTLVLMVGLYLMISGQVDAATIGPIFPVAEVAILIGALIWAANLWRTTA